MRVEWYLIHKPMNTLYCGPFYKYNDAVYACSQLSPTEDFIIVSRMVREEGDQK
jgi:hypothetical protein